jgi:hypothetical protein
MLNVLLALIAVVCFVIMNVALLVAIRLADRLERLEQEYELLKESQQRDSRWRIRTPAHLAGVPDAKGVIDGVSVHAWAGACTREVAELTLAPVRY